MGKLKSVDELFAGRHFDREVIILCVRWYLRFKLSRRAPHEFAASYRYYCACLMRTVAIGKGSHRQRAMFQATRDALAAEAASRPFTVYAAWARRFYSKSEVALRRRTGCPDGSPGKAALRGEPLARAHDRG